jgi:hypothetical protein
VDPRGIYGECKDLDMGRGRAKASILSRGDNGGGGIVKGFILIGSDDVSVVDIKQMEIGAWGGGSCGTSADNDADKILGSAQECYVGTYSGTDKTLVAGLWKWKMIQLCEE